MATFERDDATIRYEVQGSGNPVLMIAPGGMRSCIDVWKRVQPDLVGLVAQTHTAVTMDQRNAGQSTAPVRAEDTWGTYIADQLALMTHLGFERFSVVGVCIGGAYIAGIAKAAPERLVSAAMFQPIGFEENRPAFFEMFDAWAQDIAADHPEADAATWESFRTNMYGHDRLTFNATREDIAAIKAPLLVFLGNDLYHPSSTSRSIAELAPNATLVEQWKEPEHHDATKKALREFLTANPS